jgi:ketosteroid isomerase-like protein
MSEQNKATVIRFITAMSEGDAAAADKCLAPEAVAVTKGFSRFTGTTEREAIVSLIGSMKSLVPTGLRANIVSVIAEGDQVAVEFEGDAVTSEGDPYHNQYCMTFTLKDGRIVRSHEYFCTRHAEEALFPVLAKAGVLPAEGRS